MKFTEQKMKMTLCDLGVTGKLDQKQRQLIVNDLHINIYTHTYIKKNL